MRWLLGSACAYGLLIFLVLPAGVTVLNDDFGYLRSVVQTLQRGRLWTDDWLEPWAGGLSVFSALIFKITGSFYLATNGLLAGFAAIAFWATVRLLLARGLPPRRALIIAVLMLTFPTLLWKSVEFTGVALYLPCLLLALHAAERKRWGWFLAAWSVALATRQSALTWAILPVLGAWRRDGPAPNHRYLSARWRSAGVAVLGAALYVALGRAMNRTHSQTLLTDPVFDHFLVHLQQHVGWLRLGRVFCTGAGIFLLASGLGMAALRWARAESSLRSWRNVLVGLSGVFLLWCGMEIAVEHDSFSGPTGWIYLSVLGVLAVFGWSKSGCRLNGAMVAGAGASVAAVCLRGAVWDYYLLDVAMFGFFGAATARIVAATPAEKPRAVGFHTWTPRVTLGAIAILATILLLNFKVRMDSDHARIVLAEKATRGGKIQPADWSFVPFGYHGWNLHPYFIAHEGRASADIGGFVDYIGRGSVAVGRGYSRTLHLFPRFRHEPPSDRSTLIEQVRFRFLWFFHAEFFLLRLSDQKPEPAKWSLNPDEYRREPFPLNDAEWRQLILRP